MTEQNSATVVRTALDAGEGILRLAPTWVPRSFLMPGGRLKLAREDLYALGTQRGGIDERWFASTTAAANEGAPADEGLSYVVHKDGRFTLKAAIDHFGAEMIGASMWNKYKRWPVYSKFFDNLGPSPTICTRTRRRPRSLVARESPRATTFRPSSTGPATISRSRFSDSSRVPTKADIRRCLENWNRGDNGILDHSKAYRLKPGTGWLVPPCVLHAPGSLVTYEPQWGSDVFGMYQSMVEGRRVPWELLVKDVPEAHHHDLDYLIEQLDWPKNVEPEFKKRNYLEPMVRSGGESAGYADRWIVYGRVDGEQLFSACELTIEPGRSVTVKDPGAYGLVVVQGNGLIGKLAVDSPNYIRFGEVTEDEVFVTAKRAAEGVSFRNNGSEPFVSLRYFGPDTHADLPEVGSHR